MTHTFYIHINATTLSHYYVSGIIRPVGDINNREKDFQNNSLDKVILSHKKWNTQSDCSIEIVMPENEYRELEDISKDFSLSHSAIPISRVKNIYFINKERAETIIWNINSGAGFVPSGSIVYETEKDSIDIAEEYPYSYKSAVNNSKELNIRLKRFDKLLGGFAFMRAAKINDFTLDYSETYLGTLSFFNNAIFNDLKKNDLSVNNTLHNIFTGKSEIFSYLAKDINQDLISSVASRENQVIEKKFGTINLNRLDKNSLSFTLAVLGTYGSQKSKKAEDLISGLLNDLDESKREEIALTYGLYSGYTALYNSFKVENRKMKIKFDLESKLDLYIIESLYQYAFNNKTISDSFDYLNFKVSSVKSAKQGYKYAQILGERYAYEKLDYTKNKHSIIESLRKGISKIFGNSIYEINENILQDKLDALLTPKLDELIDTVANDNKQLDLVSKPKEHSISSDRTKPEPKIPTETKTKVTSKTQSKVLEKKSVKSNAAAATLDMFDTTQPEKETNSLFTYKQLDSKTIAVLKIEISNLGLTLPSSIKKKDDIIKFILSKQD